MGGRLRWQHQEVIIAVEGPSAAGKTTSAARLGGERIIAETGQLVPPAGLSVGELAAFWSRVNARRWAAALAVEREIGVAVCDTDPLKLHYDYCLARVGAASWNRFDVGVEAATNAIGQRSVGIVDFVAVGLPDDDTLERQRIADSTRRRRNFDLHRKLGPALRDWYEALDRLDPGRVVWSFPTALPALIERDRYDLDLFLAWIAELPRTSTSV